MQPKTETIFEVSWEVCNKVGGIYTVIQSKVSLMQNLYKNYFVVGPYFADKAEISFEEQNAPEAIDEVFKKLKENGINCHYGKWLVKGEPTAILIEPWCGKEHRDDYRKLLWDNFGVDTLFSSFDYDEPMVWAMSVGKLLAELSIVFDKPVAQFHEWLAGNALLYLKTQKAKIASVFTTHATMLGRSICGNGQDLYGILDSIDPIQKAKELRVMDKFSTEKACALNSDVFTTVSEITGIEAEKMFGRKPEVLLFNGLDQTKFPSFEESMIRHRVCRDIIRESLGYHFFPYYFFDTEHTLLYCIVARNEFTNKGIDVLIDALARMNQMLKKDNINRTVVVYFWIPNATSGIKVELLENKTFYRQIEYSVDSYSNQIKKSLVSSILSQTDLKLDGILPKEFRDKNKKLFMHFKRSGNPPVLTHNIPNEGNNTILSSLRNAGLHNKSDDKVKVIYSPIYLDGADGLINLNYYDALAGCHLGIFPSYYEPWGYTPLECMSFGVPAVTTDLAGFGRFIKEHTKNDHEDGAFIIKREDKSRDEAIEELSLVLFNFAIRKRADRVINKINAKKLASITDWKDFIYNYVKAHNLAFENAYK